VTCLAIEIKTPGIKKRKSVEHVTFDHPIDDEERRHGVLIYGPEGTGKTYFACSVIDYLHLVLGLEPEDICIRVIDTDYGFKPILKKFKHEYMQSVEIAYPKDMNDIEKLVDWYIYECREWQKVKEKEIGEKGFYSAWIICDTIAGWWDDSTGAQEWYTQHKRNMNLGEMRMDDNERLDPMTDYNAINPKHNNVADALKKSGVNFIWTAPAKDVYSKEERFKIIGRRPAGQKNNGFRVDNTIFLHKDPDNPANVWAFLEKSRDVKNRYGGTPDLKRTIKNKEKKDRTLCVNRVTYWKHMYFLEKCTVFDRIDEERDFKHLRETLVERGLYHETSTNTSDDEVQPQNEIEGPKKPEDISFSKEATASAKKTENENKKEDEDVYF